jgi:glucosamine--fructose-6-phosphate aminotransferase (isomerizing)
MCGIIGYLGTKQAKPYLLSGLKRMEYRGYDSAGVVVMDQREARLCKKQGNVAALLSAIGKSDLTGMLGIGHTRWATHGKPSDTNAHPHTCCAQELYCVHNGIIENHLELRLDLQRRGHQFQSDTDTEVITHWIEEYAKRMPLEAAVRHGLVGIKGSYALAITSTREPEKIVLAKNGSPLLVGQLGDKSFLVASDLSALVEHTKNILFVEDAEVVVLKKNSFKIFTLDNKRVSRPFEKVEMNIAHAKKQGYKHFMLKELSECPQVIGKCIKHTNAIADVIASQKHRWREVKQIIFVGCGGMDYAACLGAQLVQAHLGIPAQKVTGSEFRYGPAVMDKHTVVIALSQSGETADTLAAIQKAKKSGAFVHAFVNVVGSSIARAADSVSYLHVGPEIAVASTKAMHGVVVCLARFVHEVAKVRLCSVALKQELQQLPKALEMILGESEYMESIMKRFKKKTRILIMGRQYQFAAAREGALKFMEVGYVSAHAFESGELKHGPLALIEKETLCIFLAPQDKVFEKNLSNIAEVKARGGEVVLITDKMQRGLEGQVDEVIVLPSLPESLAPIATMFCLQLLAYHFAHLHKRPIDQPRNLAKSVTVE